MQQMRLLHQLRHPLQEACGRPAVHQAMVEGQAQPDHLPRLHMIASPDRLRLDAAHAEDGALRQVDDRRERVDAEHAQVGQREGAAGQLVGRTLAAAGAFGQRGCFGGELRQPLAIRPAHHRRQQPAFGVHRHGDVDLRPELDGVAVQRRVEPGMLGQRLGQDGQEEVVVRDRHPIGGQLPAQLDQRGRVRLERQRHRRRPAVAGDHALGDEAADSGELRG